MQRIREWLWTAGTVVVLLSRKLAEWAGLFARPEAECDVREMDESDGRRLWGIPSYDRKVRRYFFVSCKAALTEDVKRCAHENGLPKIDDPHPSKALVVDEVTLRRDEIDGVWQSMVSYWNEGT